MLFHMFTGCYRPDCPRSPGCLRNPGCPRNPRSFVDWTHRVGWHPASRRRCSCHPDRCQKVALQSLGQDAIRLGQDAIRLSQDAICLSLAAIRLSQDAIRPCRDASRLCRASRRNQAETHLGRVGRFPATSRDESPAARRWEVQWPTHDPACLGVGRERSFWAGRRAEPGSAATDRVSAPGGPGA